MNQSYRFDFIDTVRGLILVLMVLDHTSVFWNKGRAAWEGLPIFRDGALTFFFPHADSLAQVVTRLVTHVCAPGFIFLAGMMIVLSSAWRDNDMEEIKLYSSFLAKRGMLFIILEVTLINLIWGSHMLLYPQKGSGVSIAIRFGIITLFGFLFIILSFLRRISSVLLLLFSLGLFLGYEAVFPALALATYEIHNSFLLAIAPMLYLPTEFAENIIVTGIYPVFPWISVMLFGILFGRIFCALIEKEKMKTLKKWSFLLGIMLVCAFALYGIFVEWRLSKYPPSFGFLALTLGIILLLLGAAQLLEEKGLNLNILQTFGRVPFFFYMSHLFLYSLIPSISGRYQDFSLLETYIAWLLGLLPLIFLCRWYGHLKKKHRDSFLRYI